MEGRGTAERARVPVGMSDKSTEGEKQGAEGGCVESGGGYDKKKWGTRKRAQTVGNMRRLK